MYTLPLEQLRGNKSWENPRHVRESNPWPFQYRCSALPAELTSQLGAGHLVVEHCTGFAEVIQLFIKHSLKGLWHSPKPIRSPNAAPSSLLHLLLLYMYILTLLRLFTIPIEEYNSVLSKKTWQIPSVAPKPPLWSERINRILVTSRCQTHNPDICRLWSLCCHRTCLNY